MLIKFDVDDALADRMKAQYGQKVASKAFHQAAIDSLDLAAQVRGLRRDVQDRDQEIAVLRQTLERARSAAALLLEACGQGDLLNDSVPVSPSSRRRPTPAEEQIGTETGVSPQAGESMDHFLARLSRQGRS
ncbi:hypothetical protein [Metapseudomonas sp. CR1201]